MSVRTVEGRGALEPGDGPLLVTVGVFDGLHLGHVWLLEHLVREARLRSARPAVITFDAHPDAILLGQAPPLLLDPDERLRRLAALGVEIVVIERFDDALRRTPYEAFVAGIAARCGLHGFVMTPDAAFGHERAGTPSALAELGRREGFDVVLVPPFTLGGREVRSSDIRTAIATGHLAEAERLLGRPYAVRGTVRDGALTFSTPVALPPAGAYDALVAGRASRVEVAAGLVRTSGVADGEDVEVSWGR
ncbi:MAG TPA: FAD synthetase family protein [Candidatus Limnocylindrales bacterium]